MGHKQVSQPEDFSFRGGGNLGRRLTISNGFIEEEKMSFAPSTDAKKRCVAESETLAVGKG